MGPPGRRRGGADIGAGGYWGDGNARRSGHVARAAARGGRGRRGDASTYDPAREYRPQTRARYRPARAGAAERALKHLDRTGAAVDHPLTRAAHDAEHTQRVLAMYARMDVEKRGEPRRRNSPGK